MADRIAPELADRIVAEAMTWLKTPYHHMGDVKGVGVDCAMILLRVYQIAAGVAIGVDPRPYPEQWFLHREEARYLGWVLQYAERVEEGHRGDVAMYNFCRHAAHGAIIVDETYMIHSYRPVGMVELVERRSLEHRLDSYWRLKP